jgi:hypothetical protein
MAAQPRRTRPNRPLTEPVEFVAIPLDEYIDPDAEAAARADARATAQARAAARRAEERARERRDRNILRDIRAAEQTALEAIRQAEGKATSLLTLFGAALAATLALLTRSSDLSTFATVVLAVATAPLLGSVLALLGVLWARLGGDHGFIRWAAYHRQPDALIDHLSLPPRCQVQTQARRLADLSVLAVNKFRRTNIAVLLLLAALPLLALAAITA